MERRRAKSEPDIKVCEAEVQDQGRPGLGRQVRSTVQGFGGTCHLGDALCAAVPGDKGGMSGEDGPGDGNQSSSTGTTSSVEWGPVLEHHEAETGATGQSVEMWPQPSGVRAARQQRGIAKGKRWCTSDGSA